jgi:hypothetical protein
MSGYGRCQPNSVEKSAATATEFKRRDDSDMIGIAMHVTMAEEARDYVEIADSNVQLLLNYFPHFFLPKEHATFGLTPAIHCCDEFLVPVLAK